MTTGRFLPLAAVTTALVSSTLLMLAPACGDEGTPLDCAENCAPVEGSYPLAFPNDAGLPPECVSLNVPPLPNGKDLVLNRDGGTLTGSLDGLALKGKVQATGSLSLTGTPPPSSDGGLTTFLSLNASFTGGTAESGAAGSLTGNFTGNYSRIQGNLSQRCTVTRPFTATRR
ncbi:hypothetical protein OV208_39175 [Corallococcus sp. bb12-1]|uniref:hypothetical protein n=1 Tax=Corallococcus sp. bb12-1 TaxID=2996784 RepID=UPI00227066F2|nr:hypothetical protein [Corallococcus sp. bb12-1]MCY1047387.1 hypothetical protein [Corallococcus sp. bb12-1]